MVGKSGDELNELLLRQCQLNNFRTEMAKALRRSTF